MSENPVRRKYSRHIDIRRYFVRDMVAQQVLKLVPLRTNLMVADALTKSLPAPAHAKHRDVMTGRVPFCARTLRPATCVVGGYNSSRIGGVLLCALYLSVVVILGQGGERFLAPTALEA